MSWKEVLLIMFLGVVTSIGLIYLLIWDSKSDAARAKRECDNTAKLIPNATDHYAYYSDCYVVIDGKARKVGE